MREIKFRAWLSWDKKMMSADELKEKRDMPIGMLMTKSNFKFLQFTGLKDKKGKEIYEGDILKFYEPERKSKHVFVSEKNYQYIVEWDNKNACWSPFSMRMDYNYGGGCELSNIEVIGNIYENPELLKQN